MSQTLQQQLSESIQATEDFLAHLRSLPQVSPKAIAVEEKELEILRHKYLLLPQDTPGRERATAGA